MIHQTTPDQPFHRTPRWLRWRARPGAWTGYFALLNATYLLWLGCLKIIPAERADVLKWWRASSLRGGLQRALPAFPSGDQVLALAMAAELSAGLLLLLAYRHPLALAGIAVTVACTTSFMFTLPGWAPDARFPVLNGAGVFLLKDQFLLAATLMLFSWRPRSADATTAWPPRVQPG